MVGGRARGTSEASRAGPRLHLSLALLSAAVLADEVVLVHLLSIVHWSHVASLVIGLALLGIGASGSALAVARPRVAPRLGAVYAAATVLAGVAFDPAWRLAARVPFDAFELLAVPRQFLHLGATTLLLGAPFFLAGLAIGTAFWLGGDRVGRVYAANLLGSGAGAVVGLALVATLPAGRLPAAVGALGLAAALPLGRRAAVPATIAAALLLFVAPPARVPVSPYKEASQALELPGARVVAERHGPLGRIRMIAAPALRSLPGASLALREPVPPRPVIFRDGEPIGPRAAPADTAFWSMTTAAAPFAIPGAPRRVLVVGLVGGGMIHLARASGADSIVVVDPDRRLDDLLHPATPGPDVTRIATSPRGFLRVSDARFDRVVVARTGSLGGGAAGMAATGTEYLFTVEGVGALVDALAPEGVLAITRWALDPPRDAVRLLATAREVLAARDLDPARHVALVRGWGTVTLLVSRAPLAPAAVDALVAWAGARSFDVAWAPGAPAGLANRFNVLDTDWYRRAAEALLRGDPRRFLAGYPFAVAPVTDDAPFFHHVLRMDDLARLWRSEGRLALPYVEWGLVAQVLVLVEAIPLAALLILLPLLFLRGGDRAARRTVGDGPRGRVGHGPPGRAPDGDGRPPPWALGLYFALLGFAFMLLEVSAIPRLVLFLSEPIYATTAVLAAFLAFAGLGSAVAHRLGGRLAPRIPFLAIVLLAPAVPWIEGWLWAHAADLPLTARMGLAVAVLAPLAFAMGLPFPLGLQRVADRAPGWVPWCWGVNGFLSVIGAAAAPLLALGLGFGGVVVVGAALYLVAGWALGRL